MRNRTTGNGVAIGLVLSLSALLGCGVVSHSADGGDPSQVGRPGPVAPSAVPSSAADATFLERAQAQLASREYWASATEQGLQAPNRAHDFRTYFDGEGVRVEDRDAAEQSKLVAISLARIGRAGSLAVVPEGEVVDRGEGRVEIRRESQGVVEWFENSSAGLEQGFTLAVRPPSAKAAADLVLDLAILGARASLAGDRVRLATSAGRLLEYGKLEVVDADGRKLASHFEVPSPDRIRLVVDDADATYPIVIDPLLTGAFDAVVESNQVTTEFGVSVASAGDVNRDGYDDVLVGADLYDAGQVDEGAAFLFLGGPAGIGNGNPLTAAAVLEGNQASASFGAGVASAGDVNGDGYADIVIGSFLYDAGQANEGAAFVFHGSATGIASGGPANANGTVESNQTDARLGLSVASAGDVNGDGFSDVLAGAYLYDAGQIDEGAAFLLLGSATGIGSRNPTNAHARFEADQAGPQLGQAVASAGDVNGDGYSDVIIGAPYYDFLQFDQGGAFVYLGSPAGIASGSPNSAHTHARFYGDGSSRFGNAVGGAGDVNGDGFGDVIIGAPFHTNGQTNEGAAFVYHGSNLGFVGGISGSFFPFHANRILESDQSDSRFGASVASAGDVNGDGYADVIVGAYAFDSGQNNEGVAFVYVGSASGVGGLLHDIQYNQAGAFLGYSVASAGDVNGDGFDDVIAGAYLVDGGQLDEGAAFVYRGGSRQFERTAQEPSDVSGAGIGLNPPISDGGLIADTQGLVPSLGVAGDVNGDGFEDLIFGAPAFDNSGVVDSGIALVFHGSEHGIDGNQLTANTVLQASPPQFSGLYGFVSDAGDVNGDGYADVLVADPSTRSIYLHLGSPTGIPSGGPATANASFDVTQPGSAAASSAASAGDVNGDGYGDIVIGVQDYDSGEVDEGAVFLFLGGPIVANGNASNAHARFEGNQAGARLGQFVSSAGDVNGDGFDDLLVTAPGSDSGQNQEGAAFLFLGSAAGIPSGSPATAHVRFESDQTFTFVSQVAVSAGDVNGDGFGDVALGVPEYTTSVQGGGAVFVFHGSATGIANGHAAAANASISSNATSPIYGSELLGWSISSLGDIDGDGFDELGVGGNIESYVFGGSPLGVPTGDAALIARSTWNTFLSYPAFSGGLFGKTDVNGDGYPDLLLGFNRPRDLLSGITASAYVALHPSNGNGRPTLLKQRRNEPPTTLVSPGGTIVAASGFSAELFARSPRGRERAKLEVELCPVPVAFGNAACTKKQTPTWVDLGTTGAALSTSFTNLAVNARYAWRARTLFAASSATQPGITPIVRSGPWFRRVRRDGAEDFRTIVPEPTGVTGTLVGISLLWGMGRRREARKR